MMCITTKPGEETKYTASKFLVFYTRRSGGKRVAVYSGSLAEVDALRSWAHQDAAMLRKTCKNVTVEPL